MGKQKRQLFILLALLLAVIGCYFLLKYYNNKQSEASTENTDISVLTLSKEEVTSFSYDYEGTVYSFEKENDSWIYEGDTNLDIDESKIDNMLGNVVNTSASMAITDVTDYTQYGLEPAIRTVTIDVAGQEYILYFGDYNDLIYKNYIRVEGDPNVYTTSGYRYSSFDVTPQDLVVEVEADEESEVE